MSTHTFHTCALHLWTFFFFFFNDTATTEIYTLSLHDALPIYRGDRRIAREQMHDRVREDHEDQPRNAEEHHVVEGCAPDRDRKSTRLNSSHGYISYAVFCLKKKKKKEDTHYAPLYTHQDVTTY